MTGWRVIMDRADLAKRKMILNQTEGEKIFEELLEQYEADGMIFFKRAEAYEALGEFDKALIDFRKSKALFPMEAWKQRAQDAIDRIEKK